MNQVSIAPETVTLNTINAIEILFHFKTLPTTEHPRVNAPAVKETIVSLLAVNAIKCTGVDLYETTELGNQWIVSLCSTQLKR